MKNRLSKTIQDRDRKKFGTGYSHGFEPMESLDLSKVHDADEMLKAMSKTAFGGRNLGEAADVLYEMVTNRDCFVVLTLAGAMTMAKMGLIICDMIEQGMVHAIVSTGALMTHGLVENAGMTHFKFDFSIPDNELRDAGYDRVYDTVELERNLDDLELIVDQVFEKFNPENVLSSHVVCEMIGEHLYKNTKGRAILKSAYKHHVPVYIPAFTDSELGLDFALFNKKLALKEKRPLSYNPFMDLEHFTELIKRQKTLGIFTIGGGVPRNWAQQVGPYLDLINFRILAKLKQGAKQKTGGAHLKPYKYAIRICPEPVYWGGLSGATYSEGVSWGKFLDPKEDGRLVEVLSDATFVWPLLIKGVQDRLRKNKMSVKKNFDNEKTLRTLAV